VRRDALAKLKGNTGVTALVPAVNIHPQDPGSEPAWPFIKSGSPQSLPIKSACVDGATINFGLHAFTRGRRNGTGQLIETAEDHASRIGAAIEAVLDDTRSTLIGGPTVRYRIADMNLFLDGAEPGAFHYSCTVRARVLAERAHA
jgi:hypothetical protein